MIEIKVKVGRNAFKSGNYVYVWIDQDGEPIYIGETSKSPSDRIGLHIRNIDRSGATISKIIHERSLPDQEYSVLAFPIDTELLKSISKENGAGIGVSSHNRARKALERKVFDVLSNEYKNIHKAKGCKWTAESGTKFADTVLISCKTK